MAVLGTFALIGVFAVAMRLFGDETAKNSSGLK